MRSTGRACAAGAPQVGTNERRFAWVDAGFASWLERSLLRLTNGADDDTDGLPSLFAAWAKFGGSALLAGIRALGARWGGRHPYPADITRLLFAAAGREREAFVHDWVVGTGTFDASIVGVTGLEDSDASRPFRCVLRVDHCPISAGRRPPSATATLAVGDFPDSRRRSLRVRKTLTNSGVVWESRLHPCFLPG